MRTTRGFSLIELMVSLVIGMGLIVTMGLLSNKFETAKRESSASADMSTTAAYLSYDLDRQIRSAGSGFTTEWDRTYGCVLTASRKNTQILPSLSAFPAPFASVPQAVTMAPLIVHGGANASTPDVLQIMTGTAGTGEVPNAVRGRSININLMRVTSTLSLQANDLLLITDGTSPCMLQQVTSTADDQVNLGGDYSAAVINGQALNDRGLGSDYAQAFQLGNAGNNNPPRFFLLGVNASQQLVRYDLLRFTNSGTNNDTAVPLADGVVDMRVLYGIDTNNDGMIDNWVSPRTNGYMAAQVMANQNLAHSIIAAKVSLVLRSQQIEDKLAAGATADASNTTTRSSFEVAPEKITMFPSMDKALQSTYTVADRQRRHTVLEFTVPLRNVITTLRANTPA